MRKKCGYADKYKAVRKPTCGCEACEHKWQQKLAGDALRLMNGQDDDDSVPSTRS